MSSRFTRGETKLGIDEESFSIFSNSGTVPRTETTFSNSKCPLRIWGRPSLRVLFPDTQGRPSTRIECASFPLLTSKLTSLANSQRSSSSINSIHLKHRRYHHHHPKIAAAATKASSLALWAVTFPGLLKGPSQAETQLVSHGIPRRLPHAVGILLDEGHELLVRSGLLKNLQVLHNYALELLAGGTTAASKM
jgi:hypothetical protein